MGVVGLVIIYFIRQIVWKMKNELFGGSDGRKEE